MFLCKVLILLLRHRSFGQSESIDLRLVSGHSDTTVTPGHKVTLNCTISGSGWNYFFHQIIWYKVCTCITLPYLSLPYLGLTLPYLTVPYFTLLYLALPYIHFTIYLTLLNVTLPYLPCLDLPQPTSTYITLFLDSLPYLPCFDLPYLNYFALTYLTLT